jgi:hypothetical protein
MIAEAARRRQTGGQTPQLADGTGIAAAQMSLWKHMGKRKWRPVNAGANINLGQ